MQRRSIAALMISLLLLSACGHGAGERSFQTFRDTLTGSLVTVTAQVRADYGDTVADYTLTCRELTDGYDLTVIAPETAKGVGAHLRRGESTLTFERWSLKTLGVSLLVMTRSPGSMVFSMEPDGIT